MQAIAGVADYLYCEKPTGGSWEFGRVPKACEVEPFGDADLIDENYLPFIFNDNHSRIIERHRYVNEIYSLLSSISKNYILERNPTASSTEVSAWQNAILSVAHQESFFSHYRRISTGEIKYTRGDSGHGHGLMQIDDRFHFTQFQQGKMVDLIGNINLSLDKFYNGWLRSVKYQCVTQATDWEARARSAYSFYNGGGNQFCRWQDKTNTHRQKDVQFLEKLQGRVWEKYVDANTVGSSVRPECLKTGLFNCSRVGMTFTHADGWLLLPDGQACIHYDGELHCTANEADRLCLSSIGKFPLNKPQLMDAAELAKMGVRKNHDRHQLCHSTVPSVFKVGDSIRLSRGINMRVEPMGSIMGAARRGTIAQVLDFVVSGRDQKRYYLIQADGKKGYIYGGHRVSYPDWARLTEKQPTQKLIPQKGDFISVAKLGGINLRKRVGGSILATLPAGEKVQVAEVLIQGTSNEVYLKVAYQNQVGYLFAGQILPTMTLKNWIQISP